MGGKSQWVLKTRKYKLEKFKMPIFIDFQTSYVAERGNKFNNT